MSIAAEKINPNSFYDIYELVENYEWLKHFMDQLIELWNICDERRQQELLKQLFGRFTFIDGYQLNSIAKDIYAKVKEWDFKPGNTYIVAIADKDEVDGSIAGLQFIKNKFDSMEGWKESYFIPSIVQAAHKIKNNDNVLLFDDFIGSGKTIVRKLEYLTKKLSERKIKPNSIKVISYAGMEFGIKKITQETSIEPYCVKILKKGLTDFESGESLEAKKEIMHSLESKLGKKFKRLRLQDHSLGYRESEALFQVQGYNCPNNLFPIFWWPTLLDDTARDTLFRRIR